MESFFHDLCVKYHHNLFLHIDVDEMKDIVYDMDIQGLPTFVIMKDGKELDRVLGASKDELERKVCLHSR
ncbi:hypothetical protein KP509_06G033700 [Ceratopteris richardii]|nr:hypothetical protein KP509_06G033700 [Ceratopteris richardii]